MSNDWLVSCLAHISDELVEEAMVSKGRTKFRITKRIVSIAACVSVVVILSVVFLMETPSEPPPAATEQFTPMTLSEVADSIYADFIPDLEGIEYSLDSAGVYGQSSFKASFFSEFSDFFILIDPYSADLHDARILDMESIHLPLENTDPIFLADQFGIECMDYVTAQTTATKLIVTQFSILKDGYVARYVIKSTSQAEITQTMECIYHCYK